MKKTFSLKSISSSLSSGLFTSTCGEQNEELILQQLFKELFKLPKCYSTFSQMKSYCTLFSPILNYFWPALFKLFFFSLLFCPIFFSLFHFFSFSSLYSLSVLHWFPLFSVDFGNGLGFANWKWAWWRGGWWCGGVVVGNGLGFFVDFGNGLGFAG